jgi:hypothetical protein
MPEKVLYSNILQDFARPLLNSKDTDEEFMRKMKVIEIIWNYSVAKKFSMPVFKELDKIITEQLRKHITMKAVFDMFLELKNAEYDQYNNYILKMELRENSDGLKTFYVESADVLQNKVKVI